MNSVTRAKRFERSHVITLSARASNTQAKMVNMTSAQRFEDISYGCRRDSLANGDSNGIRATKIFQRPRSSRLDRHANGADDGWLREFRFRLPKANNRRRPIDRGADRREDDRGCAYHCLGARGDSRPAWACNRSRHSISNGDFTVVRLVVPSFERASPLRASSSNSRAI